MPFTATTATVIGTAVSVAGAVATGVRASQSARFQEDVFKQNARLARERGTAEAQRRRRVASRRLGSLRAREAPLDVIADAASELELDALLAEFEGALGSRDATLQAGAAGIRGRGALASAGIGAAGTLFSGIGQLGLLTRDPSPAITEAPRIVE